MICFSSFSFNICLENLRQKLILRIGYEKYQINDGGLLHHIIDFLLALALAAQLI